MLESFLRRHAVTGDVGNAPLTPEVQQLADEPFREVVERLGGKTFGNGLYRVYRGDQVAAWTAATRQMFHPVGGKILVFAADWLGRQFAVFCPHAPQESRTVQGLEPGVAEGFDTERDIVAFHDDILAKNPEPALARTFYERWRKQNPTDLPPTHCVGYRVPLFLGGEDDLPNLHVVDMDVYLSFCAQLWSRVRDLPDGTPIGDIEIGWPSEG